MLKWDFIAIDRQIECQKRLYQMRSTLNLLNNSKFHSTESTDDRFQTTSTGVHLMNLINANYNRQFDIVHGIEQCDECL